MRENLIDALESIDGIGPSTAEDVADGADEAGLVLSLAGEDSGDADVEAALGELEEARDYLEADGEGGYADKFIRRAIAHLEG